MIDSSDFRLMKLVHALVWSGLVISGLAVLTACSPAAEKAPPIPAVYVTPVHNDHGEDMRILSGAVRPRIESELAFRAGGKVTARLVDLGQAVRAGQPLARIDAADYQLVADAAAEQLRAAQVDATQAASDAARFKRLLLDGSVGAADHERQQARSDAAAARVVQAERQLEPAEAASASAATLAAAAATPAAAEQDPRRFLLAVMNDPAIEMGLRIKAAKALLPGSTR